MTQTPLFAAFETIEIDMPAQAQAFDTMGLRGSA